ncbi:glycosyltransferase family 2 protein [Actinopolymorpha pittospori]
MTAPDVSVLLVSWNTVEVTRTCLESLPSAVSDDVRYELIVVDNGSDDGSAEMLRLRPGLRLIRNHSNLGHSAAVNQAYRCARAELLLVLNSDICFSPGSLSAMVTFLRDHPHAAGVVPRYLYDDPGKHHYYRMLTFPVALAMCGPLRFLPGLRGAYNRFIMAGEDFSYPRIVPMPMAACLLLRRSVLAPRWIFDERLPLYFNDVLLEHTIARQGRKLWMTPESVVTHGVGVSGRELSAKVRYRHYLGGLSSYLRLTQPGYRLRVFQLMALLAWLGSRCAGRDSPLTFTEAVASLRGDIGPLPNRRQSDLTGGTG